MVAEDALLTFRTFRTSLAARRAWLVLFEFFGEGIAVEGFVLVLLVKGGLERGSLLGVGKGSVDCGGCGAELLPVGGLCGRGFALVGVTDLGSELGAVHFLEDNLRMLADLAPELLEGDFEFEF